MFKKIKDGLRAASNVCWGYGFAFKACPIYAVQTVIHASLEAINSIVQSVFLLSFLIRCIEDNLSFEYALKYIVYYIIFVCLRFLFDAIAEAYIKYIGQEKILKSMTLRLYKKAVGMDISFYDDPKFYNDFVWSMNDTPQRIIQSFWVVWHLTYLIVTALITGVYVASTESIGMVAVIISVVLRVVLHIMAGKKEVAIEEEKKPFQRRRDYANRAFYLADFAKDIRLSNIKKKLYIDFDNANEDMAQVVRKRSKPLVVLYFFEFTLSSTIIYIYLLWLLYRCLSLETIALGTVVAVFNAMQSLSGSLSRFVNILPVLHKLSLYVEKMRTFLETKNTMVDDGKLPMPKRVDITFKDVSFSYPGSETKVLSDINLHIPQGSKIALVGYNGAGKSTLVKLIMRLYDPTCGEVCCGKHNVKEYPLAEYRARISTLFQDFQIMAATLGENINMSAEGLDVERAENTLDLTGFTDVYTRLEKGMDTHLTKEFDKNGIGFSGGEAQKIAIARVLYSNADLLILDEPSSALDPLSEYTLNHTINELAGDRTVIFISHRLSTTRVADKIYMLENGRIIEQGTHDQLIKNNGKYAQMFLLEAEKYR